MEIIKTHKDLRVYQKAFESGLKVYEMTKSFPTEERYSLTDQIRRASRSVCANIAEGFQKRRYPKSFVAKLSDAEGEAAEVQVWLDFALSFGYVDKNIYCELYDRYDHILAQIMKMINNPQKWSLN